MRSEGNVPRGEESEGSEWKRGGGGGGGENEPKQRKIKKMKAN